MCLVWWHTAAKEAIKRLPLTHSVLNNFHWLQPGVQQYDMNLEVLAVADCLPQVVMPEEKPSLQEEFMDYCTFRLTDSVKTQNTVDKYWHSIGEIKDLSGQQYRFPTLTNFAKAIIIIPHGNEDTERLFSHVGLNKTKHRNSL